MNSALLLPRRTSLCHFCRKSLRHLRQQQQQHPLPQDYEQLLQWLPHQQSSRRRFTSGIAAAYFPVSSAAVAAVANSATTTSSSPRPYTRYSLYSDSVAPMNSHSPLAPGPSLQAAESLTNPRTPETSVTPASEQPSVSAVFAETQAIDSTGKSRPAEPIGPPSTVTINTSSSGKQPSTGSRPTTNRPSKLRTPRKAAMRLTPAAVEQVRALLEGPEPKLLKVGVRNRGCSGLAYNLEYVEKPGAFDELVEQDGVRVLVDSKALFSIIGSEMDWVEDKLNERFVFRNPNIKEQCGCGESFMV